MTDIAVSKIITVLNNGANGGSTVDITKQIYNGLMGGVPLTNDEAANLAAQAGALAAGTASTLFPKANPKLAFTTAGAADAALITASNLMSAHIAEAEADFTANGSITASERLNIEADALQVIGDGALMFSALASLGGTKTEGLKVGADLLGDGATLLGLKVEKMAHDADATSSQVTDATNSASAEVSDIQQLLSADNDSAGSAFGSLWTSADSSISTALTSATSMLSGVSDSAFMTNANSTSSFLSDATTPLIDLYYGAGGSTASPTLDETSSGAADAMAVTDVSDSGPTISTNLLASPDQLLSGLVDVKDSDNSNIDIKVDGNTAASFDNSSNKELDATQINSDGSYSTTVINSNNTIIYNHNPAGLLTSSTVIYPDAGYANTIYSTDPSNPWQSQTLIYNNSHQLIGTQIVNSDGSVQQQIIDASTGEVTLATTLDDQANVVNQSSSLTSSDPAFVSAVADTLASQIISNILIKNDLPASISAQAFADAVIQSTIAPSGQTFAQEFSSSLFDIAGGVAGSDIGDLVANALGIPDQIGATIGGTAGNLVTQALVQEAADALNLPTSIDSVLTLGNIASAFGGAAGAALGSTLAGLVLPTNLVGEVTGAVASAASIAEVSELAEILSVADPITAGLLVFTYAFGSDFIGTLLGDLIGDIFGGDRGNPYGEAHIGLSNGQFVTTAVGEDNDGSTEIPLDIANAVEQTVNQIDSTVGGSVANSVPWAVGYTGSDYFSEPLAEIPSIPVTYSDVNDAVANAVTGILANTQFSGGNVYMEYTVARDTAAGASLSTLIDDLGVASNYSLYINDPMAFDVALAMADSTELAQWQTELADAQSLGLDRLSYDGTTWTLQSSSSTALADIQGLEGIVTVPSYQLEFPDSSSDSFTLTEGQLAQYSNVLSHISGAFSETIVANELFLSGSTGETITGTAGGNNTISFADVVPEPYELEYFDLEVTGTASVSTYIDLATQEATATYDLGPLFGTAAYTYDLNNFENAIGSSSSDTLIAGAINQTLTGGGGSDTLIGASAGQDTFKDTAANLSATSIQNFESTDLIDITDHAFSSGVSVSLTSTGSGTGTLTVSDGGTTVASINVQGSFSSFTAGSDGNGGILIADPSLVTDDGSNVINSNNEIVTVSTDVTTEVDGSGNTIIAAGDDTIALESENNIFVSQSDGDVFDNTYGGTNIYEFGAGSGGNTINNIGTSNTTAAGSVNFLSGISNENLWLTRSGNDLVVSILGTSGVVTLSDWFGSNAGAQVEDFNTADGLQLSNANVSSLVSAMATYQTANPSFNPDTATELPTNAALQLAMTVAWQGSANTVGVSIATAIAGQSTLDGLGTGYKIVDTTSNFLSNLSFLESDANNITSISFTDTPAFAMTAAQFSAAESTILNKISGSYNVSITQSGVVFDFAQNALASISTDGTTTDYTINSPASGYSEDITWASGGKALLTLTDLSDSSFATSLSWLTSGETLQISNSDAVVYDSSNQKLFDTHVNADGTQNDTSYDTPGGVEYDNIYSYDAAGVQSALEYDNNDGSSWTDFYNASASGDPLAAVRSVDADGSGYVEDENSGQTIDFATGNTANVVVSSAGEVTTTITNASEQVASFTVTGGGLSIEAGQTTLLDSLASGSISIDASGNATLVSGGSTLVLGVNGTDTFSIGSDTISLAADAVTSVSYADGADNFDLVSAAPDFTEVLSWNPTTGIATLNLTNSDDETFATSLSYINPGDVLSVTGSVLTNSDSSGEAMYRTEVNADGSQADYSYDTTGGTWKDSIYYYDATGINTETRYDNNDSSLVDDFYNSSSTLIGQTIYNADSILHASDSNIASISTNGMTTLDVTGSASLTSAELNGFADLTNSSGSNDTLYATGAGTYVLTSQTITGDFDLSAANTDADVNLIGNNQTGQTLSGGDGSDMLSPGTGNDTLNGGTGYTTYNFGSTFGQDTIDNAYAGNTAAKGEIDFASGITDENLWFKQSGNNLVIDLLGTSDQVTVSDWFGSNAGADVQSINVNGLKLDTQVSQLVTAMATYAAANTGFNPTTATSMPTNTTLQTEIAAAWH